MGQVRNPDPTGQYRVQLLDGVIARNDVGGATASFKIRSQVRHISGQDVDFPNNLSEIWLHDDCQASTFRLPGGELISNQRTM